MLHWLVELPLLAAVDGVLWAVGGPGWTVGRAGAGAAPLHGRDDLLQPGGLLAGLALRRLGSRF